MNANVMRLVALVFAFTLTGCEWFTDFKRQPSLWTWEPVGCDKKGENCNDSVPSRAMPQNSVPTIGTAVAGYEVSYMPSPPTVDSMSSLQNHAPVSDSSIANGHMYYQINCAVCHGDRGVGDGPATKYGMPGINIVGDATKARSDGYIYGMIRNGRGLMPSYNRIEEMDRWDVVNYIRGLQGSIGREVSVGPLAAPGVTGDKLPRGTRFGRSQ